MLGLKKKGKEKAQRFHNTLKNYVSPYLIKLGELLRLQTRIRWANIWAKKHPRKLMVYYLSFAFSLLALTIVLDFISPEESSEDSLGMKSIPSMSHRLQSLNLSEIQNERIKMELGELGRKGMLIYNELDSLLKLPVKSHEDSVRIIKNYNILNKTFNKRGHEHQKD